MINLDFSDSAFHSQIENILNYYKNLLKSGLNSELESRVTENISNLNIFLDELESSQEPLDEDEKHETLYLELTELLEVYQLAGKDDQLEFNEDDLTKIIDESTSEEDSDEMEDLEDLEVVKTADN